MDVISNFAARFERSREEEIGVEEYLAECKRSPLADATAAERRHKAIGEPTFVDTRNDVRMSRLFANKVIKIYPAFAEFYGMEDAIEQVVSYFRHAAQGLEEKKQILYLLGPVGGGKSSIAERLKQLMEQVPFYAIKGSPVNESPLGLFDPAEDGPLLEKEYGIPRRYLNRILSPWAVKRLDEYGGDIRRFKIVKRRPSVLKQIGVSKTEPGDENNQDISALVGKVFHSLSLLCASTMPSNGIAPNPSVPLKLPSWVAVSSGCSTLIGALNISTNSSRPWLARHRPPEKL